MPDPWGLRRTHVSSESGEEAGARIQSALTPRRHLCSLLEHVAATPARERDRDS